MAINKKEKKTLQGMWEDAPETGGMMVVPDGKYHFKITNAKFTMESGKPQMATSLKVVGGDEEYVGEEFDIKDNLETGENMGWFKNKLNRLNVDIPESFDEIIDGTVSKEMRGKVFEGQVKTKGGFQNVYVNKLVTSDDDEEVKEEPEDGSEEELKEEEPEEEIEEELKEEEPEEEIEDADEERIEVDDEVTWTSKGKKVTGTVLEVIEDEGKARVKLEDDKKVYRVQLDLLSPVYEGDDGEEPEEDGEDDSGGNDGDEWPEPDAAKKFKKDAISKLLEKVGLKGDIKGGKSVAVTIAKIKHEENVTKDELAEACKAFGLKPKSNDKIKDLKAMILAEVDSASM